MTNPKIPERIGRLEELAYNIWWSWHDQARRVFRALDHPLWRRTEHNPVRQLRETSPDRLEAVAKDPRFLELYDVAMADFDADMLGVDCWVCANYPELLRTPVAYFSMEYALHNSLPMYAGGLGVLAGDICKEASDMNLPMVAVGFMYPQGYFHQHVSLDGWQQEIYRQLEFDKAPISQVLSQKGEKVVANVEVGDVVLGIRVWQVKVGHTNIYLLDTDLDENPTEYRHLSARLYIADRELRIQQEIVLGIGGVRVLRALGINPSVWHANEGHSAFMVLERVREKVVAGMDFYQAVNEVRATTVFTTHTPVLAGHDVFPAQMMDNYFGRYWKSLGIDRETFLRLGQQAGSGETFNMTALAMRMANHRCGVSELHEKVTRRMWHSLWPELLEDKVPISHITNGVHVSTWIAPELYYLFEQNLGKGWIKSQDDPRLWERLQDIPDEILWGLHQQLKRKLVGAIRERMRTRWIEDDVPWAQMLPMGALLDHSVLTITFARRFTEYKRAALIFSDVERLRRIVNNESYPVQIIFAGKPHPADFPSKLLLQKVYRLATQREFKGRIVFVEDYDIHMAHYLVQGSDVWLNTPRRLQEASGTSGMKAAVNGVPQLSVRDGWWHEAYNGANGWAIGTDYKAAGSDEEDGVDAESLYEFLEKEIVPLYYDQDRDGVPHHWVRYMKGVISSVVPVFCARRMLKEYITQMYLPALGIGEAANRGETRVGETPPR